MRFCALLLLEQPSVLATPRAALRSLLEAADILPSMIVRLVPRTLSHVRPQVALCGVFVPPSVSKVVLYQSLWRITLTIGPGVLLASAEEVYWQNEYIAYQLWGMEIHDVFIDDLATSLISHGFEDSA